MVVKGMISKAKKALETNEKVFINDQGFRQLFL